MKCQTRDFLVILLLFNIPIFVALSQNCIANIKNLPCSSLNVELYKGYNSKNKIDRKRILMNILLRIYLWHTIYMCGKEKT